MTKPFLGRIFTADVAPKISEGWLYGPEETAIYGGYDAHHAVDFAVPLGTPVLAAADGIAVASFEEVAIRYPGPEARTWRGESVFWGYGLFVIVLHANGLTTAYAHLHRLALALQRVYLKPFEHADGDVTAPITRLEAQDFHTTYPAVRIKAGEIIGFSGITGMGMGGRTYDNWRHNKPYRANDEEHVHFALSRLPAFTAETEYLDPFNIYGAHAADYPAYREDWSGLPGSLWLPDGSAP